MSLTYEPSSEPLHISETTHTAPGGGGLESLMVTVGVRLSDLAASVKLEKPPASLARGGGGSWRGVDSELFSLQVWVHK